MLIDWFTTIAQLINFIILVWLLKRFLYKPILKAISDREVQITEKLLNAEKIKTDAEVKNEVLETKLKEFDDHRESLMEKVSVDVEKEHQKMLDGIRASVEKLSEKNRLEFKREEKEVHRRIIQDTQKEVFAITRKVLKDLAGTTLESHMFDLFIDKLSELDFDVKKLLNMTSQKNEALIKSSIELTTKQKTTIVKIIEDNFDKSLEINFELTPDLFSGIEFIMNGQKIVWSIDDYMASLEKEVDQLLKTEVSQP